VENEMSCQLLGNTGLFMIGLIGLLTFKLLIELIRFCYKDDSKSALTLEIEKYQREQRKKKKTEQQKQKEREQREYLQEIYSKRKEPWTVKRVVDNIGEYFNFVFFVHIIEAIQLDILLAVFV
jgi:site-specific recombinase XerD